MTQVRASFVLGAPAAWSTNPAGGSSASPARSRPAPLTSTATASHSSIVDPGVLQSGWRVSSLLDLACDALAESVALVPNSEVATLPVELVALLAQSLSRQRLWTPDIIELLLPAMRDMDELTIAQCDSLRGELLERVCSTLSQPLQALDCSRSYHLIEFSGALRANLVECRSLDLDRCRRLTSDELDPLVRACTRLKRLRLSGTKIDARTLGTLTTTSRQLIELDVSSCVLSDGLAVLCEAGLPLRDLRLSGTGFSSTQLACLERLAGSLRTLHLQFVPHIRNTTLASVGLCTRLVFLDVSRNSSLDDEGLASLATLTRLRTLLLSRTDITVTSAPVLAQLTKLTHLDLSYNAEVNDAFMLEVCPALTRLRVLSLAYCGITDASMTDENGGIATHLTRLQVLKVNGCTKVGDGTLECLAEMAQREAQTLVEDEDENNDLDSAADSEMPLADTDDGDVADDTNDTEHALAEAMRESAPLHAFPHSLLCVDFGSTRATDACVEPLGQVLHRLPSLQRVGIWGSSINTARMKRYVAQWTTMNNAGSANNTTSPPTSPSSSDPPMPPASIWLLDESMKTQAGTFLFARRSTLGLLPASAPASSSSADDTLVDESASPVSSGYLYGLDEYARLLRQRKRVHFDDAHLEDVIVVPDEADAWPEEETTEEREADLTKSDDSADNDDSSVTSHANDDTHEKPPTLATAQSSD